MSDDFVVLSFALSMLKFAFAVLVTWGVLRWLDHRAGIQFPKIMEVMRADPRAAALYLAGRFVGVSFIGGCSLLG